MATHEDAFDDDRDRPFTGIVDAADLAWQEGEYETAEEAVLLALSHVRKRKQGGADGQN